MKTYREIPGPRRSPIAPCIAFYKYDGSNIRAEWTPKNGWSKFGSRRVLIDGNSEHLGKAVRLFKEKYGDDLVSIFKKDKMFRGVKLVTVFFEFYGDKSFAGWHEEEDDNKTVTLFDVNVHKRGLMLPRDFVRTFGHLDVAKVIYDGNFNKQFISDVRDGKIVDGEGVVAKGLLPGKKPTAHNIWMAKVKTDWWFQELRRRIELDSNFGKILKDNLSEQFEEQGAVAQLG